MQQDKNIMKDETRWKTCKRCNKIKMMQQDKNIIKCKMTCSVRSAQQQSVEMFFREYI